SPWDVFVYGLAVAAAVLVIWFAAALGRGLWRSTGPTEPWPLPTPEAVKPLQPAQHGKRLEDASEDEEIAYRRFLFDSGLATDEDGNLVRIEDTFTNG